MLCNFCLLTPFPYYKPTAGSPIKMAAQQPHAAGVVVFRRGSQGNQIIIQYLLVQDARTHEWTPPKGHLKNHEAPLAAAQRKLLGETGLVLQVLHPDEPIVTEYPLPHPTHKVPGGIKMTYYYLAEAQANAEVVLDATKHQSFQWLPLDAALMAVHYEEMQGVLVTASAQIQ